MVRPSVGPPLILGGSRAIDADADAAAVTYGSFTRRQLRIPQIQCMNEHTKYLIFSLSLETSRGHFSQHLILSLKTQKRIKNHPKVLETDPIVAEADQ